MIQIFIIAIAAFCLGLMQCLGFGPVQRKIIQCALHAKGLGITQVAFGGSLPDFLFAGLGLAIADLVYTQETGLIFSIGFIIASLLGGLGAYHLLFRPYTTKPFSNSTGSYESVGSGFGVGLFNIQHALGWVLLSCAIRANNGLMFTATEQVVWLVFGWLGVLLGYLYTGSVFAEKNSAFALSKNLVLGRLYGFLFLVAAILTGIRIIG